jgi:hypothetical protein
VLLLSVDSAEKPPLFGGMATLLTAALSFHYEHLDFSSYERRGGVGMVLARDTAFGAQGMAA